jgi:hypothetical protein
MQSQQPQLQPNTSAQGARLETIITSEVTLVPFPAGEYRIAIGGMEHPSKTVVSTSFPAVQVTILPGGRQTARLDTADGGTAWLQQSGDQTVLSVAEPGSVVLFTTYRPSDYATTGIRMDIERLKTAPQAGPQAPQAAPGARQFPQQASQPAFSAPPSAPVGMPGGLGYGQAAPQPGYPGAAPQGLQAPAYPGGFAPQMPGQPAAAASPFSFTPPSQGLSLPPQAGGFQPGGFAPAGPAPFTPKAPQAFQQPPAFQQPQAYQQPQTMQPPQAAPAAPAAPARDIPGIRIAAHIEREGDVAFEPGQLAGRPNSKRRLEAVALYAEGLSLNELEYAAVSYDGHLMPWVCPPQFSGTRGLGAPLLGFAARLSGETAARFNVAYSGTFVQAGPVPTVRNGDFLKSPIQGDPLESLTVSLEPK